MKEILTVGKLCYEVREHHYDLVVVDAEATRPHRRPARRARRRSSELVQVGLVRDQTALDARHPRRPDAHRAGRSSPRPRRCRSPRPSSWSAGCRDETNVDLAAVVVNRVLPELFGRGEEEVFERAARAGAAAESLAAAAGPGAADGARRRRAGRALRRTRRRAPRARCATRCRAERADALRARAVRPRAGRARRSRRSPRRWPRSSADGRATAPAGASGRRSSSCWRPRRSSSSCGSGGVGKTTDRRRARHDGGRRTSAAGCWCSPSTRPAGWPTRSGLEALRQRRDAGAARRRSPRPALSPAASCGRRCSTPSRLGRPRPPPRARRQHPRRHPGQPALPEHHRPVRPEPRLHRHGAAVRAPRLGPLRPDRGRHAADAQRARLPRRAGPHGRVLRQPAAALAHRAVPQPARHRGVEAVLPRGRPHPRLAVPGGHRRVLHRSSRRWRRASWPAASEVEPLLADRRTTFVVVTTLEAAPAARGRVLRGRAARRASCHLGALVLNKVLPAVAARPGRAGRRRARCDAAASPAGAPSWRRSSAPTPAQVARRAGRGGAELPQLPGGRQARGRAARRAGRARPRCSAAVPYLDERHPRPGRPGSRSASSSGAERRAGRRTGGAIGRLQLARSGHPRRARPPAHRPRSSATSLTSSASSASGGCWPTSASPTCCSTCPTDDGALARRRPGAAGDGPDASTIADWVGTLGQRDRAAAARRGATSRRDRRGRDRGRGPAPSRRGCWPSRCAIEGRVIAVLTREWSPRVGRQPGELERTYLASSAASPP